MKFCQPITALFDINREFIDGRTMDSYKEWLEQTIKIFPSIIIYHDGCCDDFKEKNKNFVKIEKMNLSAFKLKNEVDKVLKTFRPKSPNDITFKTSLYSLTQYSKFDLLALTKKDSMSQSFLWIDAGISRFIPNNSKSNEIQRNSKSLISKKIDYVFEIDLFNNLDIRHFAIKSSEVGTCRRVISGTSFWLSSKVVEDFQFKIHQEMFSWINQNIWDNEQVMLRNIVSKLDNLELKIQFGSTGTVAKLFLENEFSTSRFTNYLLRVMLKRGENKQMNILNKS